MIFLFKLFLIYYFMLGENCCDGFEEFLTTSIYFLRKNRISINRSNASLFFGENFFNIQNESELVDFIKNRGFVEIIKMNYDVAIEIIEKYNIKTKEDFFSNIDIFFQNCYIDYTKNIILGKSRLLDPETTGTILDFAKKYKNPLIGNSYLGGQYSEPFLSLSDYYPNEKEIYAQKFRHGTDEKTKFTIGGDQNFFGIEGRDKVTERAQLAVNRLFAPIFPMTRIIKLHNGETNYVSVDVIENNHGIDLCQINEQLSERINKFFIMIYQFLTLDYDRHKGWNLGTKDIIYDMDYMLYGKYNLIFLKGIFSNKKLFEEMGIILYTIKDYFSKELPELIAYYERKKEEDVVYILKEIETRLKMLTFGNIVSFHKLNNTEVDNVALKIDKLNHKSPGFQPPPL